jgi:hypothetical protein
VGTVVGKAAAFSRVLARALSDCEQTSTLAVRDRFKIVCRRAWRSDAQRISALQIGEHVSEHRLQRKRAA